MIRYFSESTRTEVIVVGTDRNGTESIEGPTWMNTIRTDTEVPAVLILKYCPKTKHELEHADLDPVGLSTQAYMSYQTITSPKQRIQNTLILHESSQTKKEGTHHASSTETPLAVCFRQN